MSDSNPKHESGLSDVARRALDAILGRGKDDDSDSSKKDSDSSSSTSSSTSSSIGHKESSGGGSATDILSAGTQSAARSVNRPETNMDGGSHYDTSNTRGEGAASTATTGGTELPNASDATDVYMGGGSHYDTSSSGGVQEEEEFVGSGGVGSAEFMEALRKGHEAAGGEYASDLSDPNKQDDGPTGA